MSTNGVLLGGERWTIERGNSLALLRAMPDACVDAVITDPPYSSGGFTRGDRMADPTTKYQQTGVKLDRADFAGDNRDQRAYLTWCALWLAECLRVAKPGSPICLFTDWRQLPTTTDAMQAGGWVWRGIVPWDKTEGCRPTMGRFAAQCEYVVWGSAGAMPEERGVGCLPGIVRIYPKHTEKRHLTGKTAATMIPIVHICSPGGIILDPFTGGGSTGIAALREGYRFIGMEITETNHANAVEWLTAEALNSTPELRAVGQMSLLGAKGAELLRALRWLCGIAATLRRRTLTPDAFYSLRRAQVPSLRKRC